MILIRYWLKVRRIDRGDRIDGDRGRRRGGGHSRRKGKDKGRRSIKGMINMRGMTMTEKGIDDD